jgi:hypothetical protein
MSSLTVARNFHFAGEEEGQRSTGGDVVQFYFCCGSYDKSAPGCHAAAHVSYDEEEPVLYKEY